MKANHRITQWLALVALSALNLQLSTAFGQGTAFSFQGRLNDRGNPANGIYDLRFTIYDAVTNGNAVSGVLKNAATPVTNGLFSVTLDFGAGVFTGPGRWLEVDVRTNGGGAFTALVPRQALLPVPYTVMANSASNLLGTLPAGQVTGTLASANIGAGTVLSSNLAAGAVTGFNIASNTITAAHLAPGVGAVPPGTIVLSATATNAALSSAGFALLSTGLGASWTQATNATQWAGRYGYGTLAFHGQLWVMGGCCGGYGPYTLETNDVWSSSDGVTWTLVTNAAPWGGREQFGTVAFNNQMWVMGGIWGQMGSPSGVWSSSNGLAWTQVSSSSPFDGMCYLDVTDFNEQMWVCAWGGAWSSSDGVTWTQHATNAPVLPMYQDSVAFNGRLWQMGGGMYGGPFYRTNDMWSSSDGVGWTLVTNAAPWPGRERFGPVVLNGQLWVMGGLGSGGRLNDAWSTTDGVNWTCVTNAAPWTSLFAVKPVAFNNQLWMLGNDVWYSQSTTNMLGGYYLFQKQ